MLEATQDYFEAIHDTDRAGALSAVDEALARGLKPEDVLFQIVLPAIERIRGPEGQESASSLAQQYMAAVIAAEVTERMVPLFRSAPVASCCVVMGNSRGDFHGLGRRIVVGCLRAMLMEVVDLGLNVAPEAFVDAAVSSGARVIGISSMMDHTARGEGGCRGVRRILQERGLEAGIRLAVGGAPYRFDPELYRAVGADAWAPDGLSAGQLIGRLARGEAA